MGVAGHNRNEPPHVLGHREEHAHESALEVLTVVETKRLDRHAGVDAVVHLTVCPRKLVRAERLRVVEVRTVNGISEE